MVETTSTDTWHKGAFTALVSECEKAREEGKYAFVWDKNGNAPMFFKYKGQLIDIGPLIVGKAIGQKTDADIAEYLRSQLVVGQRSGDKVMIALGKTAPKWDEIHTEGVFHPQLVFDRTEWFKEENYIKFVKEEENHSVGGLNPGMYRLMDETFSLTVCSQADSEEEVLKQVAALPHADKFKLMVIS